MFKNSLLDFRNIEWIEYVGKGDIIFEEIDKLSDPEFEEYYNWLADEDITIIYDTDYEMYLIYPLDLEEEVEESLKNYKGGDINKIIQTNEKTEDSILKEYISLYKKIKEKE